MTLSRLTYVLPLKWSHDDGIDELVSYVNGLAGQLVEVIVVDGSPEALFRQLDAGLEGGVRHVRPDACYDVSNGKVAGVMTGMSLASNEHVIIADDDVRYDVVGLARMDALLDSADIVRPQNVFAPAPWHARWDTGRTLLNRALAGGDYPGTYGVRRSAFRRAGGYDGNVMFENLEMVRTLRAHGAREVSALDLFVTRRPCSTRHFWSQRARQAYDDLAQPSRLVLALATWPTLWRLRRRPAGLAALTAGVLVCAEAGRRRAGGRNVYSRTAALWAPLWLLERATCSWVAVGQRLVCGGVAYRGRRVAVAAHSPRHLRRQAAIVAYVPGVVAPRDDNTCQHRRADTRPPARSSAAFA